MGQLDNQSDSQPIGSLKGVIHLHARPLIESVADEQAATKAAPKPEQPRAEAKPDANPGAKPDASAQAAGKAATETADRAARARSLSGDLLLPSIWNKGENKPAGKDDSKAFKSAATLETRIDLDKFKEVQARWYENKAAREEKEEEERKIADHKDFENKQAVVDAVLDPTLTPALGAFANAALRLEDRVPLFGRQMGKIMLGGAITGLAANSVDVLARSQTTPGSLADKVFTPSKPELYAVGLTAGMPLPLKIRIPIAAATWVGAKVANYYFADKQ